MAHFALSYVLRYGGMLQESRTSVIRALSLDPGNYQLRSCSLVFDLQGNSARAMDFLRLDLGSEWVSSNLPPPFSTRRQAGEARDSAQKLPGYNPANAFMKLCVGQQSSPDLEKATANSCPPPWPTPTPRTDTGTRRSWLPAVRTRAPSGCSRAPSRAILCLHGPRERSLTGCSAGHARVQPVALRREEMPGQLSLERLKRHPDLPWPDGTRGWSACCRKNTHTRACACAGLSAMARLT